MTNPRVKRTRSTHLVRKQAAKPIVQTKHKTNQIVQSENDLVKHLASREAGPFWILLGILIVTLPDVLKNSWWLGPSIAAAIAGPYYWMFTR